MGLTVMAVVAAAVSKKDGGTESGKEENLLVGYKASFWTAFAGMALACVIGAFGLRRMGKVGVKRD